jgi:hypothetical protein
MCVIFGLIALAIIYTGERHMQTCVRARARAEEVKTICNYKYK